MTLRQAQAELKAALGPLGIEIGDEVLALWEDRAGRGAEVMPSQALERLGVWAIRMLAARESAADEEDCDPAQRVE